MRALAAADDVTIDGHLDETTWIEAPLAPSTGSTGHRAATRHQVGGSGEARAGRGTLASRLSQAVTVLSARRGAV